MPHRVASKKPPGALWRMWAPAVVLLAILTATFALIPLASAGSQTAGNPCAVHIPVHGLPHRVTVYRHGRTVPPHPGMHLQQNDMIRVGDHRTFVFSYAGNSYRIHTGLVRLSCRRLRLSLHQSRRRVLAVGLDFGLVHVMHAGHNPRTAAVVTPEMVAVALAHGNRFDVSRNSRHKRTLAWTATRSILVWEPGHAKVRVNTRHTYTAISGSSGLRLNVWPFAMSARQRHTRPGDRLVPFWADGRECSVGCTPAGVRGGWPLKPFHQQHTIRSALNELRPPSSFHVALDIDASNGQPVYAIQSGHVNIRYLGTPDVNVDVGHFYYWHIHPAVHDGQYVRAYKTVLGNVLYGFKHVAFSEIGPQGQYLNPLRPGRSLRPYTDTAPPIIGTPRVFSDGRVIVAAFDPQSHIDYHSTYLTPVLAPAALAWRLYDAGNHAITGLNWALRGSQLYPPSLVPRVFAPGAKNPGFDCFYTQRICIPHWIYWLAGGLTPGLPLSRLRSGRYRLTVYAWDWAGNTSALDYWIKVPFAGARAPSGRPIARFDYP